MITTLSTHDNIRLFASINSFLALLLTLSQQTYIKHSVYIIPSSTQISLQTVLQQTMDAYSSYRRVKETPIPSFSSTLLDAIYRSIDEGEDELDLYREAMRKKQETADLQRGCIWMEKKESQKVEAARARDYYSNSSSTSSSESDSVRRPKPIRTGHSIHQEKHKSKNTKHEGGVASKTKSRALKLYSELKKVKNHQPISPGAKLVSFLNTLFAPGNLNKPKIVEDENSERKSKSATASTCSSASSLSRSCLSKNSPSSRTRSSNPAKRSVRFYPVSVIVDEDSKPCGQRSLYFREKQSMQEYSEEERSSVTEELKLHIMEKNRRVEEAAMDLLRNYQKRVELEHDFGAIHGEDDEEDEDDLFELDTLCVTGMERYREELPVYETTRVDTNRAIANGMIL